MRILMSLAKPFRPDVRVYNEALSLIARGHEVALVAWDRDGTFPLHEDVKGIDVRRIRIASKKNILYPFRLWRFWRQAYRMAKKLDFDAVHCHDLDTLPIGVRLKRDSGTPLIYDIHDIYSYMIKVDVPNPAAAQVQRFEDKKLRAVDRVVTVSEGLRDFYATRGLAPETITVVMNCKPLVEVSKAKLNALKEALGLHDKFVTIYIGTLEDGRFIEEMVQASERFDEDTVMLIGGVGRYEELVKNAAKKSGTLRYLGTVHPDEVPAYIRSSDVVLSIYHPSMENQNVSIVSKFFDAVNAARPLIVNRELRGTAALIRKHGCGIVIPYDVDALVTAIAQLKSDRSLCNELGANSGALKALYNWDTMVERLVGVYDALAESTG